MSCETEKYRRKFSFANKYCLNKEAAKFAAAVVIPSCAEKDLLPETLHSLAQNDKFLLKKTAIIIVFNHPRNSQNIQEFIAENRESLFFLEFFSAKLLLNIFYVQDFSGNFDLELDGGVGEARKIGMDIALRILDPSFDSFITSLDADTTVETDYLTELFKFFEEKKAGAATLGFSHSREKSTPELLRAIEIYEKYLMDYVEGLKNAGSPYAFHSIGSAMAFTPQSYIRAGGMKIRRGGEDFYFLQELVKTSSVSEIKKILVHPSARLSERVPFGTGPALKKIISGEKRYCHNQLAFNELKKIIESAMLLCENRNNDPLLWLSRFDNLKTREFLLEQNFPQNWKKIVSNTPDSMGKRLKAFQCWFDAFKTLKFIHFCENRK